MGQENGRAGREEALGDIERLMEHAGFLRALAGGLARPGLDPDDLVQETYLAALRARWSPNGFSRSWLAAVLRNVARQKRRSEMRRRAREETAAVEERLESGLDLLQWRHEREALMHAVGELREPYRSTILLRYVDGLPPRKIAARQNTPVRTVTTRLHRGMVMLRHSLRPRFRERTAGVGAVLAFVFSRRLWSSRGALGVTACLAVVPVVGLFALAREEDQVPGVPQRVTNVGTRTATASEPAPRRAERREAEAPAEVATAPVRMIRLAGRVIDVHGEPRAGVPVQHKAGPHWGRAPVTEVTLSGADGRFDVEVPSAHRMTALFGSGPGHVPVVYESVLDRESLECVLVVDERRPFTGRVGDEVGGPVENARGKVMQTTAGRAAPGGPSTIQLLVRTDAEGRFRMEEAYFVPGATLLVKHTEHVPWARALDYSPIDELEVVMRRPSARGRITGRVLDRAGSPVAEAFVTNGTTCDQTRADGSFALPLPDDGPVSVVAADAGWMSLPVKVESDTDTPTPLDVRLELPSRSIKGRLLDALERPVQGCPVWIANPSPFGRLLRGIPGESGAAWFLEDIYSGRRNGMLRTAYTDADGGFELTGLDDKEYELRFVNGTHGVLESGPVPAGSTPRTYRFDPTPERGPLIARVVNHDGAPVPAARISVGLSRLDFDLPWERAAICKNLLSLETVADADGWFRLDGIPVAGNLQLDVTGPGIFPANVELADWDTGPQTIEVARRIRLRVAASSYAGDSFRVLDGTGNQLPISVHQNGLFAFMDGDAREREVAPGTITEWEIPENAAELVTYREESILRRSAIAPDCRRVVSIDL